MFSQFWCWKSYLKSIVLCFQSSLTTSMMSTNTFGQLHDNYIWNICLKHMMWFSNRKIDYVFRYKKTFVVELVLCSYPICDIFLDVLFIMKHVMEALYVTQRRTDYEYLFRSIAIVQTGVCLCVIFRRMFFVKFTVWQPLEFIWRNSLSQWQLVGHHSILIFLMC